MDTKPAAKTANDKKKDSDETKLDAPEGADLGNAEAVPPPEPAEELEVVYVEDPSQDYQLCSPDDPDAVHVITKDATKAEGQNLQSVYAKKKD